MRGQSTINKLLIIIGVIVMMSCNVYAGTITEKSSISASELLYDLDVEILGNAVNQISASASQDTTYDYTLYSLSDSDESVISIPADCPTSVQLTGFSSSAEYWVSDGYSVKVSRTGLVEPDYKIWYWKGNWGSTAKIEGYDRITKDPVLGPSTVKVYDNGTTKTFTFNVVDYADKYADDVIQDYIDANITDDMSDYEKLEIITAFPANYDYSVYYQSYTGMIIHGGGDCWASANTIKHMCDLIGIDAHVKYAANDDNAGSGHRSCVAIIDDKVYECEAGYGGNAPRAHHVTELTGGFSYKKKYINGKYYAVIHQYDGNDTELTIPATIDGYPVIGVGIQDKVTLYYSYPELTKLTLSEGIEYVYGGAFNSLEITELNLPSTLKFIDGNALTALNNLTDFNIADGAEYVVHDNCVYTKDMKTFVWYPCNNGGAKEFTIPDGVESIYTYAFFYSNNITKLTIPASVNHIGTAAIPTQSNIKTLVFKGSMPAQFDDDALYRLSATVYVPHDDDTWNDCSTTLASASALTYNRHTLVQTEGYEPTCDETGLKPCYVCSECGAYATDNGDSYVGDPDDFIIPALGHTLSHAQAVDPTCTEDGIYECYKCDVCGKAFSDKNAENAIADEDVVRPATGHNMQSFDELPASCITDGNIEYWQCNTCHKYYSDKEGAHELNSEGWIIKAYGHDYSDETIVTEATCENTGIRRATCSHANCSSYRDTVIPALGHKWAVTKTVDSTCDDDGYVEYTCSRCNDTKTTTVGKKGHKYDTAWATDTNSHWHNCTNDGCTSTDSYEEHTPIETVVKQPTCTENGISTIKCSICNRALVESKEIPATGHTEVEVAESAPTCENPGYSNYTKCSTCGIELTERVETEPALGHKYDTNLYPASNKSNGYWITQCSECNKISSYIVIPAVSSISLDHTSYVYSGTARKPQVTVKDSNGNVLTADEDYSVSYDAGCTKVGKYTVTVTGLGEYSYSKPLTFTIKPKGTAFKKLSRGKKCFTAKWTKNATQTTGYEIRYSLKSNMSKAKTVRIKSTRTTSKKISKLKAKKKYYVQIRTYKTVKGVNYYSSWSAKKTVKTK